MTTHTEAEMKPVRCAKHNCEAVPMESRDLDGNWHYWVTCKNIIEPCDSGMSYSKDQIHELWNLRQETQALLKDKGELDTALEAITARCEEMIANQRDCGDYDAECPMQDAGKPYHLAGDIKTNRALLSRLNPTTEGQQF